MLKSLKELESASKELDKICDEVKKSKMAVEKVERERRINPLRYFVIRQFRVPSE